MKVLLKRTWFYDGKRYRVSTDGVEVPDDAPLPSDAKVWRDGEWVDAYAEGDSPRDRAARVKDRRREVRRNIADAVAGSVADYAADAGVEDELNERPKVVGAEPVKAKPPAPKAKEAA